MEQTHLHLFICFEIIFCFVFLYPLFFNEAIFFNKSFHPKIRAKNTRKCKQAHGRLFQYCFHENIDLKVLENLIQQQQQQQKQRREKKKHTDDKRLTSSQENFETSRFHYQNTAITNLVDPYNLL